MDSVSKTLMILGLLLIGASLLWHLTGGNIPIGKLPGDIKIETENTKIYFPLTTGLILSLLFSLLSYLFRK
jgi:hypothetical protein